MGRLNYRSRLATFFEKLVHFFRFVRKIRVIIAQTLESKKLRIGNGIFDMGYTGETGRRLGDRFREHLRDVEKDDKDALKPVAWHFNLPNHSKEHMSISGLSLQQGTTDSRKNLEQRFVFQIGTLNPHGINERFSFN